MAALVKLFQRFYYDQIGKKHLVFLCGELSRRYISHFLVCFEHSFVTCSMAKRMEVLADLVTNFVKEELDCGQMF